MVLAIQSNNANAVRFATVHCHGRPILTVQVNILQQFNGGVTLPFCRRIERVLERGIRLGFFTVDNLRDRIRRFGLRSCAIPAFLRSRCALLRLRRLFWRWIFVRILRRLRFSLYRDVVLRIRRACSVYFSSSGTPPPLPARRRLRKLPSAGM